MAKIKIITSMGKKTLKCRLVNKEFVNGRELDFLAVCPTQCFLRPMLSGEKTIFFLGADGVPSTVALKDKITKQRYFLIIAQLIEMMRSAQQYSFDLGTIDLEPEHILINRKNGQIFVPYLPVVNCETTNGGIIKCLRQLSTIAVFASDYDYSFADDFMCFVMGMGRFSIDDAENYIREVSPDTAKQLALLPNIKNLKGLLHEYKDGSLPDAKPSLFRLIFGDAAYFTKQEMPKQEKPKIPMLTPKPLELPEIQDDTNIFAPKPHENNQSEIILADDGDNSDELEDILTNLYTESSAHSEFERPKEENALDKTAELDIPDDVNYPEITRRATGVTYSVDKSVYKIGKENAKVDLYVTNNQTVSRVHVHIISRNGVYYIVDQNSTNRTFVNGIHVPPQVEYKLRDGDEIKLSNEIFDFRVKL